jgi:hypothetical protein
VVDQGLGIESEKGMGGGPSIFHLRGRGVGSKRWFIAVNLIRAAGGVFDFLSFALNPYVKMA